MPLASKVHLDHRQFRLDAVDEKTRRFVVEHRKREAMNPIIDKLKTREGIREERAKRRAPGVKKKFDCGRSFSVDIEANGDRKSRSIPVRMFQPSRPAKGIFMHLHGGGWVLNDEDSHDEHAKYISDRCDLIVLTVGYRLAPEHPHPHGAQDCYDVAHALVSKSKTLPNELTATDLTFLGGESAGAHLALLTFSYLCRTKQHQTVRGLSLPFGCYDLSYSPSLRNATAAQKPFAESMKWYICRLLNEKCPDDERCFENRRDPEVSPLYVDWRAHIGNDVLPPALFMCGTDDPLIDDSCFMAGTWTKAGGSGILLAHPGGWHGYIFHDEKDSPLIKAAKETMIQFINDAMDGAIL